MLRPTLTALLAALCLALAPRPAAAAGGYLTLSAEDCTRLARHYPADDVTYRPGRDVRGKAVAPARSEEHTSELQSLMRISYAVFCLKKKNTTARSDRRHT